MYVEGADRPRWCAARPRLSRLSLNVDAGPFAFSAIDPCGFPGLKVTQMKDLGLPTQRVGERLSEILIEKLDA